MTIRIYSFPDNLSNHGYHLFPDELENDPLVLFHGTFSSNLHSILVDGFKPASLINPSDTKALNSISFAKVSLDALSHIMGKRGGRAIETCIIAVRYENIDRAGINNTITDINDSILFPPPTILGYCIVPAGYLWR